MNRNIYRLHIHGLELVATLTVAVLVLVGCQKDDGHGEEGPAGGTPLTLGVAQVVESQTRSGAAGSIDYSVLSKSAYGFGVMAGAPLNWTNQQVTYVDDSGTDNPGSAFFYPNKWKYDGDVKYWNANLNGGPVDFYAYAPYVASPSGSVGITAISGTTVSYTVDTDITQGVDLLWGVNGQTGKPWKNTTYADDTGDNTATGGPVLFTFRHALSAIGFRAQVMIGQDNEDQDLEDQSAIAGVLRNGGNYKVTIKKIELSGDMHPSGVLDLDNTKANTPNWSSKTTATAQTLTVTNTQVVDTIRHLHDNATSTSSSGTIDTDGDASNDSDAKKVVTSNDIKGVSQALQQQLVNDANGREPFFFVIPSEKRDYTLTLHWCVSAMLPDETTYVSEDHVNNITLKDFELKAGTKYVMTFVIGLKLIGLVVNATDWVETSETKEVIIEHGTSASESLARGMRGSREK